VLVHLSTEPAEVADENLVSAHDELGRGGAVCGRGGGCGPDCEDDREQQRQQQRRRRQQLRQQPSFLPRSQTAAPR